MYISFLSDLLLKDHYHYYQLYILYNNRLYTLHTKYTGQAARSSEMDYEP